MLIKKAVMPLVYKSGQTVPVSGQYAPVFYDNKTGRLTYEKESEITCVRGKTFPPRPKFSRTPILLRRRYRHYGYWLVDRTKHFKY